MRGGPRSSTWRSSCRSRTCRTRALPPTPARTAFPPSEIEPTAHVRSIWPAIYPKLLELVQEHTSTIIFVNNRRASERLAKRLNELANGEGEHELPATEHGGPRAMARVARSAPESDASGGGSETEASATAGEDPRLTGSPRRPSPHRPTSRSPEPTTGRSPTRSAPWSRSCSSPGSSPAWSRRARWSSASTWAPSTW